MEIFQRPKTAKLHFNSMFNELGLGQPDMQLIIKRKKWNFNIKNIMNNMSLKIVTKSEDVCGIL